MLAWDPSRRRAWQVGFGRDHHAHAVDAACLPGCIPATIDPLDEDMVDASLLALTDANGGALWHPRGIADFDALPARVFSLWLDIRDGSMNQGEAWAWWCIRGDGTSHLFPAAPGGQPSDPARCGQAPDPAATWERSDRSRCRVCVAITERDAAPKAAFGSIGGVSVGAQA